MIHKLSITLIALTSLLLAAEPDIVINNSTGSDTAASGAPSGFGPFGAVATCHTNGIATNVIEWPANPLAGVPVDGSAVLWLATGATSCNGGATTGCRFRKITARTAGTVTVEDSTFNIPAGAPVDCAVGGKRSTLTSTRLFQDARLGWAYNIENTGVNYTVATSIPVGDLVSPFWPRLWIRGTGATRPIIQATAAINVFTGGCIGLYVENLSFLSVAGATAPVLGACTATVFRDIRVDGFSSFQSGVAGQTKLLYRIETVNGSFTTVGTGSQSLALDCYQSAASVGATGISLNASTLMYVIAANNTGAGSSGVDLGTSRGVALHVTAYNNNLDGFVVPPAGASIMMVGSLSTNNGNDGVQADFTDQTVNGHIFNNNAFFSNAGLNYNNAPVGPNDTTGVNPGYINAGATNWGLGTALLNLGWPPNTLVTGIGSLTTTNTEPGASQRRGGGAANYAY
jgi:hypothetical protein